MTWNHGPLARFVGREPVAVNDQFLEACRDGRSCGVKKLLEGGADVNARVDDSNSLGGLALIDASSQGHLDVMKLLLERGADVNAKNGIGSTALGVAQEHEAPREIIDVLLAHGAQGRTGDSPD